MRLYSLFMLQDKKYYRIYEASFTKAIAVQAFQNCLLNGSFRGFNMALRPVKDDKNPPVHIGMRYKFLSAK